jgi:hypothetical protein
MVEVSRKLYGPCEKASIAPGLHGTWPAEYLDLRTFPCETRSPAVVSVLRLAVAGTAFLSVAPACGFFSSSRNSDSVHTGSQVVVAVESHSWSDITVYLIGKGLPQRLGMVTALGNSRFDFSSQQLNGSGGVRLRALPVGGRPFTSETIPVQAGQSIFWTLEDNLETSNFTVY